MIATWGDGSRGSVALASPEGIALDASGTIYVTEQGGRVVRFGRSGAALGQWGTGAAAFNDPSGIAVDPTGTMYVTEYGASQVDKLAPDGHLLASWR
jgi:DNA-binding beta-propeller fold protein YncE